MFCVGSNVAWNELLAGGAGEDFARREKFPGEYPGDRV